MSLDAVAEWSRYVVIGAMFGYLAAWLAFCTESGLRGRVRRLGPQRSVAAEPAPALVSASRIGAVAVRDGAPAGSAVGEGVAGTGRPSAVDPPPGEDAADLVARADRAGQVGRWLVLAAAIVLAVGVAMRGVGTGRAPWANMYEFSTAGVLIASIVFLTLGTTVVGRLMAIWVTLLLFVTLGLAVGALYVPPGPLVPALRSYWLVLHVGCAVVAFGLFTVAAVASGLQIAAERSERRGVAPRSGWPGAATLDRLVYRLTAVAFPIWTFGPLILGAIWAEVSWGRFWGWDPKEVWALITWLVYAAYLHARATAGWKGAKASVVGLVGYATVLFSYFGVNILFNGLHSYGGV